MELTDTYIAAAEIDYGPGWNYEATLTHFAANPSAPMADLAVAEVAHWDAHHARNGINDALLRSHAALDEDGRLRRGHGGPRCRPRSDGVGLELFPVYVNPGHYYLITSVTDIWGNVSSEADPLVLDEALGP